MKIVKLKVLNTFFDNELGEKRFKNNEFECSEKRAKQILEFKDYPLVEIISITKNK